jgi:RNA polymerase sigma factor (sigma-70 family)
LSETAQKLESIIIKTVRTTLKEIEKKKPLSEKSYFSRTERLLYSYPSLKVSLNELELNIHDIELEGIKRKSTSIVVFSGKGSSGDNDEQLTAAEAYKESKERTQRMVNRIERALDHIRGEEGYEIIEMKYFDNMNNLEIADKIPCSESTVKRWRKRLVNQLGVLIFGVDALEEN